MRFSRAYAAEPETALKNTTISEIDVIAVAFSSG